MAQYFLGYCADSTNAFLIEEDFGKQRPITDPEKIKQLKPLLQNTYFMSDGGYLAAIKLVGAKQYVYQYLPKDRVPLFIKA